MEVLNNKKILIIQTAFLGDAILTLPLIQVIKQKNENCTVDVIAIPSTKTVFENSSFVDKTIVLDKKNKHKSLLNLYAFISKEIRHRYDVIISPHRSFRTSLMICISNVPYSIGFNTSSLRSAYKKLVVYNKDEHEVKRNFSLIDYTEDWKVSPQINIDDQVRTKIDQLINETNLAGKSICAIAPGSVWATKKYPQENFESLISLLINDGFSIALIGGEADEELCENIKNRFDNNIMSFAGKLSIVESIELINRSSVLVSNDSAPTHMAMCTETPAVTIFCSTVPEFGFYPYKEKSVSVGIDTLDCKPCGIHGHMECPEKHFKCGTDLKPEQMHNEIIKLLKK